MNEFKVSCVIVTYNRKELLKNCILSVLNQTYPLDKIIVIDNNSSDTTQEIFMNEFNSIEKICYIRLECNIGGAGGFYEGIKYAYEKNYDWIWIMDDDSQPQHDALEKLFAGYKKIKSENIIALTGLKIDTKGNILRQHRGIINFQNLYKKPVIFPEINNTTPVKIQHSSFVGLLLNRDAIKKTGLPDKNFFIYYDDLEYSIRLSKTGYMYLISDSRIVHKEVSMIETGKKKFLFIKSSVKRTDIKNLWTLYYLRRNIIYLAKKYQTDRKKFYIELLISYLRSVLGFFLFDRNFLFLRIKLITKSYIDGLSGNLGIKIKPDQWKEKYKK